MDKELEEHYSENHPASLVPLAYSHENQILRQEDGSENGVEMVDYMLNNPMPQPPHQISLDKLCFADVMQFADFGPKLGMNQSKISSNDDNHMLKFQLLNDSLQEGPSMSTLQEEGQGMKEDAEEEEEGRFSENISSVQQLGFASGGGGDDGKKVEAKNRRKRPRSQKTSEEVESQRMTHIAVERNRRRQMNDHLRVLRSLMPGSYVQRGDQASIIGGAIEFVRELEQLLQCLESQKRRKLYGASEAPITMTDASQLPIQQTQQQPLIFPPAPLLDFDQNDGLTEETAENKSCLADIEVRLLGFDAMIKILSRRRPGQLLKVIAAFEDLQFQILHTNITTIEQTVLYTFNIKITGEIRCTAEDIANSVQQILSFINTNTL